MEPDFAPGLALTPLDQEIWAEELESFLPPRIFDAHTHLWSTKAARAEAQADNEWCRHQTDGPALQQIFQTLYPGREVHCLAFGLPMANIDYAGLNQWVADQVCRLPNAYGAMLIHPEMPAQIVADSAARGQFVALKPYHQLGPADNPAIAGYFPESLMEVADALRLPAVLHCRRGIAHNCEELQRYCRRFPGIQWILAHCGAMFNPRGLKECVQRLGVFPNLWYDTALICEIDTLAIVLKYADRRRVLFGTDSALGIGGCRRGRVLSYAHSTLWLKQTENATLWAYEQLRALARGCELLELDREEVENLLYRNALRLLGDGLARTEDDSCGR